MIYKEDLILIIGVVFCILGGFIGGSWFSHYFIIDCQEIQFGQEKQFDDITFFQDAARRFADNHTYEIYEYDCVPYSIDFQSTMNHLGYNVGTKIGCKDRGLPNESCHMWNTVIFEVESITGAIETELHEVLVPYTGEYQSIPLNMSLNDSEVQEAFENQNEANK